MSKKKKNKKKNKKKLTAINNLNFNIEEQLIPALQKGDLSLVQLHLDLTNDRLSYHSLQTSIEHNQEQIATWLITNDCKINRTDYDDLSDTPLHLAVHKNYLKIVEILLSKNAYVNEKNIKGETPLHISCRASNVEITRLLLEKNAALDITDCFFSTPLHIAVEEDCLQIVQLLLNHENNINAYTIKPSFEGFTPLHIAVIKKNLEVMKILVENNADINAPVLFENNHNCEEFFFMKYGGYTPLHLAIEMGDISIIKFLLEICSHKIKINFQGLTPFHIAIEKENLEIITLLLNLKININFYSNIDCCKGLMPLHMAIINKNYKLVELLLQNGADIDALVKFDEHSYELEGFTPLHLAVKYTCLDIVKLLLDYYPDAVITDAKGFTPLHIAVEQNNLKIVKIILDYKIQMNLHDIKDYCRGLTPFHIAIIKENLVIAKLLLENGADINETISVWLINSPIDYSLKPYIQYKDFSPLHVAVKHKNLTMIQFLLDNGAKINSVTKGTGLTPLHLSIKEKNKKIFYFLLKQKANFKIQTKDRKNILHLAIENNWPDLVKKYSLKTFDINDRTINGDTLLSLAVRMKKKGLVEYLLKFYDNIDIVSNIQSPLHVAVELNELNDILKILLPKVSSIDILNNNDETPLCIAVKNNNPEIVMEILKFKPSIHDISNKYAFSFALKNCEYYIEIINLLFQYGFLISSEDIGDTNILNISIEQGHFSLAAFLLKNFSNLNKNPFIIHDAVKSQNISIVLFLTKEKYNLNLPDDCGKTPVDYAMESGNSNLLDLLLKNGATASDDCSNFLTAAKMNNELSCKIYIDNGVDINMFNEFGTTALHFATWNANYKFVELLLNHKAFVNTTKNFIEKKSDHNIANKLTSFSEKSHYNLAFKKRIFTSPLHIAIWKKRKDICDLLIDFHADVNARDGFGRTALHFAASIRSSEQEKLIVKLINCGAGLNIFDDYNKLPIHYAYHPICMCNIAFQNQYELYCECECNLGDDEHDHNIISLFVKYIALMTFMNKTIHEGNFKLIFEYEFSQNLYVSCMEEINKMKEEKISNYVSYFDILTKSSLSYVQNENVINVFQSDSFKNKFPIYHNMLEDNFNNLQDRKLVIQTAIVTLNNLAPFRLPEDVSQKILENLFINNLKNLIEAGKL